MRNRIKSGKIVSVTGTRMKFHVPKPEKPKQAYIMVFGKQVVLTPDEVDQYASSFKVNYK